MSDKGIFELINSKEKLCVVDLRFDKIAYQLINTHMPIDALEPTDTERFNLMDYTDEDLDFVCPLYVITETHIIAFPKVRIKTNKNLTPPIQIHALATEGQGQMADSVEYHPLYNGSHKSKHKRKLTHK